jgi:hypothetical protein
VPRQRLLRRGLVSQPRARATAGLGPGLTHRP